ncbi:MAG: Rne/Rng family ribonuclease [Labrys sp. (in: a-proteobacteria)]
MANKMLIDASHPEETRVVVVKGNRVEEFDFEAANRKQLRGNIYLAKVTRVEPSLQAAFVDYGGNRHGFLAFSEIHPDYYQIPVADRQALLAEERRAHRDEDDEEENGGGSRGRDRDRRRGKGGRGREKAASNGNGDSVSEAADVDNDSEQTVEAATGDGEIVQVSSGASEEHVEALGGADALEEMPERVQRSRRQYKIQEVIKRRQVLLVQVVKEERGNKGAALTTYLSLAGRYSVLMPNTARGGGISRKITNAADRKRLKTIAQDLDVPDGMGVILRTAGAARTKAEVKRDFEYLLRLWENVRDLTLKSSAPTLVYEEGSLIKRSIRDLYNKDIDEVIVAGDDGYREAKDFMRMLMPSHAKNVQPYKDPAPLFQRFGVEAQLDAMFSPQVTLRSGGYIVINQTEALVSIDVNSGRATREHNIEDTALKTNLEAAEEISRQLRLRDLAGLIVIDFIDMDESRNNRSVERKLKECLKNDRARIQVGRISHFGLMEMSRQRIRTGVLESSTELCPHCGGTGHVRAVTSVALHILRGLEDMLLKSATHNLVLRTRANVAMYVLNHKRAHLHALEARFGVTIVLQVDETILGNQNYLIERGELATPVEVRAVAPTVQVDTIEPVAEAEPEVDADEEVEDDEETTDRPAEARRDREDGEKDDGRRRRRRRRRRRGGQNAPGSAEGDASRNASAADEGTDAGDGEGADDEDGGEDGQEANASGTESERNDGGRRRRRGRRGGRRNRREDGGSEHPADGMTDETAATDEIAAEAAASVTEEAPAPTIVETPAPAEETPAEAAPAKRRRGRKNAAAATVAEEPAATVVEAEPAPAPVAAPKPAKAAAAPVEPPAAEPEPEAKPAPRDVIVSNPSAYVYVEKVDPTTKKAGWWSKR